jgi:hypothetical protein
MPEDQAKVEFLTRDFVVEPLLLGRDDPLDIALALDGVPLVAGDAELAVEFITSSRAMDS